MVLSALVVRAGDPVQHRGAGGRAVGRRACRRRGRRWSRAASCGCASVLGAAAIESGAVGLPPDADRRRARPPACSSGCSSEAGRRWPGGDPARASYLVQEALDLWRGRALADLEEWEPGRVEAARLEGLRMDAEELRVEAEIARRAGAQAVLERARALVAQAPFRERRWALLATALHQSGRQAEALAAVKRARAMLVDELGLDPGPRAGRARAAAAAAGPVADRRGMAARGQRVCPYRGLLPYDAEDADSFFGREDDVAACLRRLRDAGVLAVVGPSGVGKSSLVRAGVVASLVRGRDTGPGDHARGRTRWTRWPG